MRTVSWFLQRLDAVLTGVASICAEPSLRVAFFRRPWSWLWGEWVLSTLDEHGRELRR